MQYDGLLLCPSIMIHFDRERGKPSCGFEKKKGSWVDCAKKYNNPRMFFFSLENVRNLSLDVKGIVKSTEIHEFDGL